MNIQKLLLIGFSVEMGNMATSNLADTRSSRAGSVFLPQPKNDQEFREKVPLIRSALESPNPGAFKDGSNVEIWPLGTDLVMFEVAVVPNNFEFSGEIFVN